MSNKVPKLRFNGFDGEWEERSFFENISNIIDFRGRTPKKLGMSWSDKGYLALSALNVKNGYIDEKADAHYGDQELYDKWMSGRELYEGQVLFTTEAPMGNVAQVPDDRKYILSQRTIAFDVSPEKIGDNFLAVLLRTPKSFNELSALSSGGTAKGVSQKSLSQFKVTVPNSLDEQIKIGNLFKAIDTLISLRERRLDLLKEQKRGFLQKLFPKTGEVVPELRFSGFTEDWVMRKLGDIASFSKGNGYTKNDLVKSGDPIILYGRLYTKYETVIYEVDTFVNKKDKSIISEGNEVLVPASGETSEDISRASVVGKSGLVLGGDLNIIKPENHIDSIFLALTISNGSQQKEMSKRAQGKSVVHLHNSDLQQVNLLYPTINEQKKIGAFFNELENSISKKQEDLYLLKEQKKGLLQNMFI